MVIMLMLVAGISAGEFLLHAALRCEAAQRDARHRGRRALPVERVPLRAVGALTVSLALLLALLVWYVFWLRARIPDVG